jgi:fructosamine-3-kinase
MSITFLNQPKLSGLATYKDQDERRLDLIPKIESWLTNHQLFKDKQVSVEFFQTGETGLVSIVIIPEQQFVLKVLLRSDGPQGEPEFLNACESVGVSVPHVYEFGMLNEYPYMLMSYINAKSLDHSPESELLKRKIFKKMGEILRKVHQVKAKGFGRAKEDGIGEYETFSSWISGSPQIINPIYYLKKYSVPSKTRRIS